jgi:hypothetical protein
MKIKIKKLSAHFFQCFSDMTYNVHSGNVFGDSCSGKTSLLRAITACFVNTDLHGKKLIPLQTDAPAGWVKIEYDIDGESQEAYRTWMKTETGYSSSSSLCKTFHKNLFLAIANPMYVIQMDNADRLEFFVDFAYHDYRGDLLNVMTEDMPIEVQEFAKKFGSIEISKLRTMTKMLKGDLKDLSLHRVTLETQIELMHELGVDCVEKEEELNLVVAEIEEKFSTVRIIDKINNILIKSAIDKLNDELVVTHISDEGKIFYGDAPIEILSSSEKLDCGLELANATANRYEIVPPTLIDDATAYGHTTIDGNLYKHLSQIITASYAKVDLCEHDNECLHGLDRTWKTPVTNSFRPEVQIELIPIV